MNVLIVNRFMGVYGGAETVIKELSFNLNNRGVKNLIITLNISDEVRKLCSGLDIIVPKRQFPYQYRSTGLVSSVGIVREMEALRKLVKQYHAGFDMINVHNFPANWVAGGLRKPVVWMCNEVPDLYNNPHPSLALRVLRRFGIAIDKSLVNSSIQSICVADELNARRVKARYDRESTIVPYGINHINFSYTDDGLMELRRKYAIGNNDFVLLQVGVISPQKNQMESIRALKVIIEKKVKAKLILVGNENSPYGVILRRYIRENNLDDDVFFTGQVNRDMVIQFYSIADVCLFPVKDQGGWLAPFEALSRNKPVIVSGTMGAASLIQKNGFGIVSDDFGTSILEFVNNQKKWEGAAGEASLWIKENLTWQKFSDTMIRVFEDTIRGFCQKAG